jgi:hypothetical protein
LALLAIPAWSGADIYQFVDAQGTVHYTNVPTGGNAKRVLKESSPASKAKKARTQTRVAKGSPSFSGPPRSERGSSLPERQAGDSYSDLIASTAGQYGIDAALVRSIIRVESNFNPLAVSRKGAMGLMQLMPDTAARYGVRDAFNPAQNISGGVRYLSDLFAMFGGNLPHVLAAYNAGEQNVLRWNGVPPFAETQDYVRKVTRHYTGVGWDGSFQVASSRPIFKLTLADGTLLYTDDPGYYGKRIR